MFDLSLGEVMLVVVAAVVFIGPKELPVVIKAVAGAMQSLRGVMHELRAAFDELASESGLKDARDTLEKEVKMIRGDDGDMYESYDLSDVMPTTPKPAIRAQIKDLVIESEAKGGDKSKDKGHDG